MRHLEHDKLIETLEKLAPVLYAQGFKKGSFQIGFNPESMDQKLSLMSAAPKTDAAPIRTIDWECHFGGCGHICCTF